MKYSFISDCNGIQYSFIGTIESPGYPVMPRTAVTCKRKVLLTNRMQSTYVTYKFSVFDMASCRDVEMKVTTEQHVSVDTEYFIST